jgi:hypothetical protein
MLKFNYYDKPKTFQMSKFLLHSKFHINMFIIDTIVIIHLTSLQKLGFEYILFVFISSLSYINICTCRYAEPLKLLDNVGDDFVHICFLLTARWWHVHVNAKITLWVTSSTLIILRTKPFLEESAIFHDKSGPVSERIY